jgi:adenylylsulfate kinase-like enzyme
MAQQLVAAGIIVLCAFTSPFREAKITCVSYLTMASLLSLS